MLSKNLNDLADYLKDNRVESDMTVGICLLCKEDNKAKKLLEYCKSNPNLEDYEILQKAVEISDN